MKIYIDTNTFPTNPALYADAGKTQRLPQILPVVQLTRGELQVGFVGDNTPPDGASVVFAATIAGTSTQVVAAAGTRGESGEWSFDLNFDSAALAAALAAKRSDVLLVAGIVVETATERREWQLRLAAAETATGELDDAQAESAKTFAEQAEKSAMQAGQSALNAAESERVAKESQEASAVNAGTAQEASRLAISAKDAAEAAAEKNAAALNLKANDSDVVHNTGTETIYGEKIFNNGIRADSFKTVYGTSLFTTIPSKGFAFTGIYRLYPYMSGTPFFETDEFGAETLLRAHNIFENGMSLSEKYALKSDLSSKADKTSLGLGDGYHPDEAESETASVIIGNNTSGIDSPGYRAVLIGSSAKGFDETVTIGTLAAARRPRAIAVGTSADAEGNESIAIGYDSLAQYANAVSIGHYALAVGDSVAIGAGAMTAGVEQTCSVALGATSFSLARSSSAIGAGSFAVAEGATAVGANSVVEKDLSCAFGFGAVASGAFSNAIGCMSKSLTDYTTALFQCGGGESLGVQIEVCSGDSQAGSELRFLFLSEQQYSGVSISLEKFCEMLLKNGGGGYSRNLNHHCVH